MRNEERKRGETKRGNEEKKENILAVSSYLWQWYQHCSYEWKDQIKRKINEKEKEKERDI